MGFIRNLLRNREKSQLEELLVKDPSPSVYLRLARIYQEEGDLSRASKTARQGAAKFPESAEITSIEQDLTRLDRDAEVKRLRQRIESYPNPRLYSRLAELLRAGGQVAEAQEALKLGLRNYPDYGGLYYVLGLIANDAGNTDGAREHLSKAAELDNYNYAALKLLGQVNSTAGLHAEAADTYARILSFSPNDDEIKALRGQALEAANKGGGRKVSPTTDTKVMSATQSASKPRVAAGGSRTSRRARFAEEPSAAGKGAAAKPQPKPKKDEAGDALEVAMGKLGEASGIQGAVLVDNYGLPVASQLPEGMEEALAAAMTTGLRRSGGPACGELGLGNFEEMVVETPEGAIYVYALREMTLAVFAEPGAKAGLLERQTRAFAEKALEMH
ncbi:MAG: tetratricopeptide repeat protein [Planctomycetota bacterium]|jgi:predicted regulator of Ras-like GTPase activity (Roadblock/LC7/MglB family)/Flp pilus assembly protein TadD